MDRSLLPKHKSNNEVNSLKNISHAALIVTLHSRLATFDVEEGSRSTYDVKETSGDVVVPIATSWQCREATSYQQTKCHRTDIAV